MKKMILHIGAPKCGSSALQSVLEIKEKEGVLAKYDFTYPLEHSRGFGHGNANPLYHDFIHFDKVKELPASSAFLNKQTHNVIISDEMLYGITNAKRLNQLLQTMSNVFNEIIVLVAFREPTSWLLSDYSQHIKQRKDYVSSFVEHIIKREHHCNWNSHYLKIFSNIQPHIKIYATESHNVFNSINLLTQIPDIHSCGSIHLNTNPSLSSSVMESQRLMKILNVGGKDIKEKLETFFNDYNISEKYKYLLEYLKLKYENYANDIATNKNIELILCN